MVCSSCGAEIADKAIVCYRCGTPTAIPAAPPKKAPARRPVWPALAATVVIVLLAIWVVPMTPPASVTRYVVYAAVVIVVVMAWFVQRR